MHEPHRLEFPVSTPAHKGDAAYYIAVSDTPILTTANELTMKDAPSVTYLVCGLAMLALLMRRARGLHTRAVVSCQHVEAVPAAAKRRLDINRLEREWQALKAQQQTVQARAVRKQLNALKRSEPDRCNNCSVRVATFFKFHQIADPDLKAAQLGPALDRLRTVLGSVTVSSEGVNGAVSVPAGEETSVETVISDTLDMAVTLNWAATSTRDAPFLALKVRTKAKALTDALGEVLDWSNCGEELEPAEWHEAVAASDAVVLDVRNTYESGLGKFRGALTLDTDTFSETWPKLDRLLANVDPNTPVLMYCTGGVRCVKSGAYVIQKLGFKHVRRLKDGIIGYERWIQAADDAPSSCFQGHNFVFDRRTQSADEGSSPSNSES